MNRVQWAQRCQSAKTVPTVVVVHGRDRVEVGRLVRFLDHPNGRWQTALVRHVGPGVHFQADRM